ncbi:hypothetical protein [Hymenobacter volaticus]|uniref:Uncharacterized protein n=1 Tax=Hymenobacter volaticus TaxID=2932254 RepID=A0ABY4GEW8_9BACT|nr:hypothetical protein [Hymenobacter volaticus]UOQ69465.1 hypothetical protein MUN86_28725 [Hymenobacter volaticus]
MPDTLIPTRRHSLAAPLTALNVEQAERLSASIWHDSMVADAALYQATAYHAPRTVVSQAVSAFVRPTTLLARVAHTLRSFLTLPADWDSYGAQSVQPAAVEEALALLQDADFLQLMPAQQPRLAAYPLSHGGIQFDLNGGRWPLEIEISPDGQVEFTIFGPANEVLWETNQLREAINWSAIFNEE